jgi:dTDP-glucose pyrophosphorylase
MAELIDTYLDKASNGSDAGKKRVASETSTKASLSQGDTEAATAPAKPLAKPVETAQVRSDQSWWIQVGVAKSEQQARALLTDIRSSKDTLAANAVASAEKVHVSGKEMWRSRFTKLSEADAASACLKLKKRGIACFASRS